MREKTDRRGTRHVFALFLSILIGLAGTVTGTTVAHAEEVDAIVPGSLKLEKLYEQDQPLYVRVNGVGFKALDLRGVKYRNITDKQPFQAVLE